jgi:hypothetical protein
MLYEKRRQIRVYLDHETIGMADDLKKWCGYSLSQTAQHAIHSLWTTEQAKFHEETATTTTTAITAKDSTHDRNNR